MDQKSKDELLPNDPLTSHEYDGIKEFDNPLPGWWLTTFLGTIIFGFIYAIHYMIMPGTGLTVEFNEAWKSIQELQASAQSNKPALSSEELAAVIADPANAAAGTSLYVAKCAACHGQKGEGLVGPNLTDKFWVHGRGEPAEIMQVISKGVLDKGMPAWEVMISKQELQQVVAYVVSIRGKNLPGKAPQGQEAP